VTSYIFLDLDGVLNSMAFYQRRVDNGGWLAGGRPENEIDPQAVGLLDKIVQASRAKIVISSSWRKAYSLTEIREAIHNATKGEYPAVTESIIDETPHWVEMHERPAHWQQASYQRGFEIAKWLVDNTSAPENKEFTLTVEMHEHVPDRPQLDGFVILDDDSDMAWLQEHFVKTEHDTGLLPEHIEKVLKVLSSPIGKVWP
jgi:hypothetical protein